MHTTNIITGENNQQSSVNMASHTLFLNNYISICTSIYKEHIKYII